MKTIFAILLGAAVAISATLIHQSLPPFGVAIGIASTFISIWWIGRKYGKRRYKLIALISWLAVISRAGSFAVGNELLIQGDSPGSSLLSIGFAAGVLAVLARL